MAIMIYVSELKVKNLYKKIINNNIVFVFNGQVLRNNDEAPIKKFLKIYEFQKYLLMN